MRVVIIGGTGHIGTFLVPRLVAAGHEVVVVSRSQRQPYVAHGAWDSVTTVTLDRAADGFGAAIADLGADVVIDLICFAVAEATELVESLRGRVEHFLHCGTIWVHGPSASVPTTEAQPRRPINPYGRAKADIEDYLRVQARRHGFPATVVHPGHISGPGWVPINPAGNVNPEVFTRLARGEQVVLPNHGMETVQHVHADDVAQVFVAAMERRAVTIGESFHAVAATATTLRGFAEAVAGWFGRSADLAFLPWEQWRVDADPDDARLTLDHISHSPHCSIEKPVRLLGYRPRYTALEAVRDALDELVATGVVTP
ncbi:NAD-dependent epimerase/dehydratase family protein [Pseudonocardia sp. CA-107938]|uniref:NAD-dependent epimerase/dehydratase family protein n=1 Tax=Pseudonocardia sp. CA-107938 TaxID=3240021 RepID=UPI003D90B22D